MTEKEVFERISRGGSTDFAEVISLCNEFGRYCLIGGLAVNCYVEPVYTMDADIVLSTEHSKAVCDRLRKAGFAVASHPNSLNAHMAGSALRIQFTTDPRYQAFIPRAESKELFGIPVPVARLEDLVQGKIWAWSDSSRRLSKRQKDQADLVRIAETHPAMLPLLPDELRRLFGGQRK